MEIELLLGVVFKNCVRCAVVKYALCPADFFARADEKDDGKKKQEEKRQRRMAKKETEEETPAEAEGDVDLLAPQPATEVNPEAPADEPLAP